ncbi:glutathione peroxidase [Kytococcus sedentarius]|uniref:glutathione peroxidase n=1 Tax=Kytococcus sedentarius TaxID=1276 RepID=UPI0035BC3036
MTSLTDFTATALDGTDHPLDQYAGQVVLVVNTASRCGFTPQYEGLEELYQRHREEGFVVLGFPCNQFARQEPGSAEEIQEFCSVNYGVSFPVFARVDVNGAGAHPLWQWLKQQRRGVLGGAIPWNFTKFLVGRDGQVIDRFAPTTTPARIEGAVERALTRAG